MTSPDGPAEVSRDATTIGFNLSGLLVFSVLVAVGCAYGIDAYGRWLAADHALDSSTGAVAMVTIGSRELSVPTAMFANKEAATSGFSSQVDIVYEAHLGLAAAVEVRATLLSSTRVRSSASLLDSVYLHQFDAETLRAPPGLVGKPVVRQPGQADETVWYDPLAADPFVARCQQAVVPDQPSSCLRAAILPGGIGVIYAFSESALSGWRGFDAEAERALRPIGAWSSD